MAKFVGTWRGLKKELARIPEDWAFSWRNRHEVFYHDAIEIRDTAFYGRHDYIVDEDGDHRVVFIGPGPQPTEFGIWLGVRVSFLWYAFIARSWAWFPCWAFGHDIVDSSYGGPDSGCIAGDCKRCGFSYHTQLY